MNSQQKIVFVTGKGGVGKSLIAASMAFDRARQGRKTLLVELGDTSYYQDLFSLQTEVTHQPQMTKYGFSVALWGGESSLREYVLHYLRMEKLYKLFFDNRVMRALVNVAPGLPEIAMLGKITSGIRHVGPELPFDDIIVDSYATGHTLALLRTPNGMKQAIPLGPMGKHSSEIDEVLHDSKITSVYVVTLLEELPVVESLELVDQLKKDFGITPTIVANRVLKIPVPNSELENEPGEFAKHLVGMMNRQKEMRDRLSPQKVIEVPQIFSSNVDQLVVDSANAMGGEK